MKTDDLIRALAADAAAVDPPIGRTLAMSLAIGVAIAAAVFALVTDIRPDVLQAAQSWQFVLKFVFTLGLLALSVLMFQKIARPESGVGAIAPWLAVPALLMLGAVAYDYIDVGGQYASRVVFSPNWSKCVLLIPLLSLAPLAAALYALKQGAPANPTVAGAVGGLLSGAIGATLYASHCDADSPLFVGIWYPFGIAVIAALGALIGSRFLKW